MPEKVLKKDVISDFITKMIGTAKTIAPVAKPGGFYQLEAISKPEEVALECPIPYESPKKFLFPAYETLVRFGKKDGKLSAEAVAESEDLILFGLHPCDVNALWLLDAAFETDNKDANYLNRRERATIVALDCLKACDEYAFCADMKTNVVGGNYDLLLTDIGDAYFVDVVTDRGVQLIGEAPDATAEDKVALKQAQEAKVAAFEPRISFDTDELPSILDDSYDSLVWAAIAKRCFSCGSCNLVCPTCYCFGVEDKLQLNLTDGQRQRFWDSCQLAGFAEIAGGENFRGERSSRLRHRFMRKGKLLKEMFDRPGCVGCGRCDRACTAKISSVETYNQLKGGV